MGFKLPSETLKHQKKAALKAAHPFLIHQETA